MSRTYRYKPTEKKKVSKRKEQKRIDQLDDWAEYLNKNY